MDCTQCFRGCHKPNAAAQHKLSRNCDTARLQLTTVQRSQTYDVDLAGFGQALETYPARPERVVSLAG